MGDATARARLYGEPLFELPTDLYIPPDALEIFLDAFEGPLDLLLYLIRRQNFNILDIPMQALTAQYMGYVQEIRSRNLELAADYLLMAAMLIEIKSRMLLPRPPSENAQDDDEDPRAQLVRRLLEYEKTKIAAHKLNELPQEGRDFWVGNALLNETRPPVLPNVDPDELRSAWLNIIRRSKLLTNHTITRETLSVRDYMVRLLKDLRSQPYVEFEHLFDASRGIPVLVVTFIAMLELAKETLIEITQAEAFAPIYVMAKERATPENQAESTPSAKLDENEASASVPA